MPTLKKTKEIVASSDSTIRIKLTGDLDVQDMSNLFHLVDIIYRILFYTTELDRYLTENPTTQDRERKNPFKVKGEEEPPFRKRIWTYDNDVKDAMKYIIEYDKFKFIGPDFFSENRRRFIPTLGFFRIKNNKYFVFELPKVIRTSHSSPGFTDIFGFAKIIKLLKETITYYLPNKKDKEQIEILRQDRLKKLIQNMKSIGFSDIQIREFILNQDKKELQLKKLIEEQKVNDVE